jgi:hypothetical protein
MRAEVEGEDPAHIDVLMHRRGNVRADPIGPTPKLESGMTVWIDEAQAG